IRNPQSAIQLSCWLFIEFLFRPIFFYHLPAAGNAQSIRRNIVRDRGTGRYVSALADSYRRNQLAIAADKDVVFDDGLILSLAVIVAGDRAGADINPVPDFGVADVGQMSGLRSIP